MDIVYSKNEVPIRMTEERWFHIVENHNDLAGRYDDILRTVEDPDMIIQGYGEALMALRKIEINRWLVVIYKEVDGNDGFVVTAYQTSKVKPKGITWKKTAHKKL